MKTKLAVLIFCVSIYGCTSFFFGAGRVAGNALSGIFSRTDELLALTNSFEKVNHKYPISLEELHDFAQQSDTLKAYYFQLGVKFTQLEFLSYNPDSLIIKFVSFPFNCDSVQVNSYHGKLLFQANSPIVYISMDQVSFIGDPGIREGVESGDIFSRPKQ